MGLINYIDTDKRPFSAMNGLELVNFLSERPPMLPAVVVVQFVLVQ